MGKNQSRKDLGITKDALWYNRSGEVLGYCYVGLANRGHEYGTCPGSTSAFHFKK